MIERFENFIFEVLGSSKKQSLVIFITLGIFFFSLLLFPFKGVLAKMLPDKSANTFSIYIDAPTHADTKLSKKISDCVINALQNEKEIINLELFIGGGAPLDYAGIAKGIYGKKAKNIAQIVVNLTPKEQRDKSSFILINSYRQMVENSCKFDQTSIKFIQEPAGPPTLASIVAELYSQDTKGMRILAQKIATIFKNTPHLVDVDILEDDIYDNFSIVLNTEKIAKSALNTMQINQALYLALKGKIIGVKNASDKSEQIGLFVQFDKQSRTFLHANKDEIIKKFTSLKLKNAHGFLVPLSELVEVKQTKSKPSISMKNLKNYVNIVAETDGESQVYPLLKARDTLINELSKEYTIQKDKLFDLVFTDKNGSTFTLKWDGEMKVSLDTFYDLGMAFFAALALIFFLLVAYYKSFSLGFVIVGSSFLSLWGVIVGHWFLDAITHERFFLTATSLIGFIVLMGISSRNSMLLIDFAKVLIHKRNVEKNRAIAIATATRAKPIFLTAGTVVLASVMLVFDPIFSGLGASLIFGTIAGMIVSLSFVPILLSYLKAL